MAQIKARMFFEAILNYTLYLKEIEFSTRRLQRLVNLHGFYVYMHALDKNLVYQSANGNESMVILISSGIGTKINMCKALF